MVDYIEAKALAKLEGFVLDETLPESPPTLALDLDTLPCGPDEPPLTGCVVDAVLAPEECARLVHAAEQSDAFAFWDASGDRARRSVRNADTLELNDTAFCAALWQRLSAFVPQRCSILPEDSQRYEPDLEGEWQAIGLNPHLLINRYAAGGHFAPHADGSTLVHFNERSLYTVLIYLNDCPDGGATQLLSSACGETSELGPQGARVARPEAVVHAVRPECGRALMYYHQVLHAGQMVGRGCTKYCLRTDVMYTRVDPICTAPNDLKAFELVQQARALEADGEPMQALPLYMRAAKLSEGIAKAYRLR